MADQRTISKHTIALTLFVAILGLCSLCAPQVLLAQGGVQDVQYDSLVCQIGGALSVGVTETSVNTEFTEELSGELQINNSSEADFAGATIALGLVSETSGELAYWFVFDDVLHLAPGSVQTLDFNADTANVEAGEYSLIAAVAQGDDFSVLGTLLRDSDQQGVLIEKNGAKSGVASVAIQINGTEFDGNPLVITERRSDIVVDVRTNNNSSELLPDSQLYLGVSQGDVPLGAAVTATRIDSLKLIPGAERRTQVVDRSMQSSAYTVYAAVKTPGTFQPVVGAPVLNESTNYTPTLPYVSEVGTIDGSNVVVCVNETGEDAESAIGLVTPVSVGLMVTQDGDVVYSDQKLPQEFGNEVVFESVNTLYPATFDVTLYTEQAAEFVVDAPSATNQDVSVSAEYEPVAVTSFKVPCTSGDCMSAGDAAEQPTDESMENKEVLIGGVSNFWHYIGIMLAATLLMYIVLRRLHPETNPQDIVGTVKKNKNELQ